MRHGEVLGLIGRSGAGKSTLVRCINGLERPDSGAVELDGRDIAALPERELPAVRRRIGMVFQHFNLLSAKTVAGNVELPLRIAGAPAAARRARTAELLDMVGLSAKAAAYPAQLSGGQKQRVGIARALAASPTLLLSDEATSALDPETTRDVLRLLRDINRRLGLTVVLITHEMSVVREIADRVIVLDHGRVAEEGFVREVFASPCSEVARSMLRGAWPELPPRIAAALHAEPRAGDDAVLRLELREPHARRPVLAELARAGVDAVLAQGAVTDIQGEPVGVLFIRLPAEESQRAAAFLRLRAASVTELGHVARDV